jgi:hypothetical protein
MDPNAVVDVAIGLILMYLVLSLICTVVNEHIATLGKLRARTLRAGIEGLLDDPVLRADFYDHGIVASANAASGGGHPSYLSGRGFATALLGSLDPTKPVPQFADIESAVRHLPDSNIRDILLSHVATTDKDMTSLRDDLAIWFDHAMDRVGGVYKRWLKLISFVVGLAVAVSLNVDSLKVASALWHDGSLRQEAASLGDQFAAAGAPPNAAVSPGDLQKAEEALRPLPIGWNSAKLPDNPWAWFVKAVGLLITGLALMLGAPFWFDLLSKFINIRGAGARPKRTVDEPPDPSSSN